jgi:transcriptional regulator with XRE-family HTH domain
MRELRRASGLNGKQLATKLGWYGASRVSKLELGQQTPSHEDLLAWSTACNAPEALAELRIQLNAVETFYTAWRRQLYAGVHARQTGIIELITEATTLRAFECSVVPGPLQTPEYARRIFEGFATQQRVPPELDEAVRLRIHTQDLLHTPSKSFHFVITEGALHYAVASPDVILSQLDKLLVATTLRNVQLGVIPFPASLENVPQHGFWILDDRLVLVETYAAELRLTERAEVSLHERIFSQMAKSAIYGDQARRLISHIARTLVPPAES